MRLLLHFIASLLKGVLRLLASLLRKLYSLLVFISRRWYLALPFYGVLAFFLLVSLIILRAGDPDFSRRLADKRVNDITQLNPVQVAQVIRPETVEEIRQAVSTTSGPISIGGGRFSMGGQTAFENSLHIDMRSFNEVLALDTISKTVRVQPGISWRKLQEAIDPYGLSVKIMQTYANFTVGGSISVNCHGRYIGHGPIVSSVKKLKLVLANGDLITASRTENPEIFKAAVGGYGGIGVIVEASLQLVDNTKVARQTNRVPVEEYASFFQENIAHNDSVVFQNGDLYPPDYSLVNNVCWKVTDAPLTDTEALMPVKENYWLERQLIGLVSRGDVGKWVRRHLIDPIYYASDKVVWRNYEASYAVEELEPRSREESTYVLQEYFIPVDQLLSFIPKMREVFEQYQVNVINVSIRHAYPDQETYLSWAPDEVFAFVVYFKQGTDAESKEAVGVWTRAMTDAILSVDGSWYLPYQPHATQVQFEQAYPQADTYFQLKGQLDSSHRFTNQLLDKYNPYLAKTVRREKKNIKGYYRPEEQTLLTIPEWYLVFNPKEYADYLAAGHNPSEFPFYASIQEYWRLYDRVLALTEQGYPQNEEYVTMLQVIGVSATIEYTAKMLYENSVGWLFSLFSEHEISDEEELIIQAHQAYSEFIYHTAWYEFEFLPWVKKVWNAEGNGQGSWLRKAERMLLFTVEFTVKAAYAELIGWAAEASYEAPVTDIYLTLSRADSDLLMAVPNLQAVFTDSTHQIVSIPRWGTFTDNIQVLAQQAVKIQDIGGNDEVAISVITQLGKTVEGYNKHLLFTSALVSQPEQERLVYFLAVDQLIPFLREIQEEKLTLEHVYDY